MNYHSTLYSPLSLRDLAQKAAFCRKNLYDCLTTLTPNSFLYCQFLHKTHSDQHPKIPSNKQQSYSVRRIRSNRCTSSGRIISSSSRVARLQQLIGRDQRKERYTGHLDSRAGYCPGRQYGHERVVPEAAAGPALPHPLLHPRLLRRRDRGELLHPRAHPPHERLPHALQHRRPHRLYRLYQGGSCYLIFICVILFLFFRCLDLMEI